MCAFSLWPVGTRILNCGFVAVVSTHLCGPPALKPALHWRIACAALHGALVCKAGSNAQSSGPIWASQITTKRARNSWTDIQNSPSSCVLDASSSRSLSLKAFHSQLLSDQAPPHTPPYSPPAQGLCSLIRFVSWELPELWDAFDELVFVRTLAKPVIEYGCSGRRPKRRRRVPFS